MRIYMDFKIKEKINLSKKLETYVNFINKTIFKIIII